MFGIKNYLSSLFVSIILEDEQGVLKARIYKHGRLKSEFKKSFAKKEELLRYLKSFSSNFSLYRCALFLDDKTQGLVPGTSLKNFNIEPRGLKTLPLQNATIYTNAQNIGFLNMLFENYNGLDFLYSPFVLLFECAKKYRAATATVAASKGRLWGRKTPASPPATPSWEGARTMFVLKHDTYLALIICQGEEILYGSYKIFEAAANAPEQTMDDLDEILADAVHEKQDEEGLPHGEGPNSNEPDLGDLGLDLGGDLDGDLGGELGDLGLDPGLGGTENAEGKKEETKEEKEERKLDLDIAGDLAGDETAKAEDGEGAGAGAETAAETGGAGAEGAEATGAEEIDLEEMARLARQGAAAEAAAGGGMSRSSGDELDEDALGALLGEKNEGADMGFDELGAFAINMQLNECIVSSIDDFYHDEHYRGDFVSELVIFSSEELDLATLDFIENQIFITPKTLIIDPLDLMIELMQKELK